jgi:hypothetical protein
LTHGPFAGHTQTKTSPTNNAIKLNTHGGANKEKHFMSWQNAPTLTKITASQQGGNRGAQLWGVQANGTLNTIYQVTPGGGWSQ